MGDGKSLKEAGSKSKDAVDVSGSMTAWQKIIWQGSDGDLPISQVHWCVAQENPSASISETQTKTLDTIRLLVNDGLFVLGAMTGKKGLFEAWDAPLEESMSRIRDSYVGHFDEGRKWHSSAWIYITDKGRQEADRIERKYFDPSPD